MSDDIEIIVGRMEQVLTNIKDKMKSQGLTPMESYLFKFPRPLPGVLDSFQGQVGELRHLVSQLEERL